MIQSFRAKIERLPRTLQMCVALLCGAIGGLAQEPYSIPGTLLVCLCAGFFLHAGTKNHWHAARTGWLFGTGYFLLCLTWITEPFMVDAARHGWMAPFALVLLSAGLALFWAAAFGVARAFGSSWALVLTWPLAEISRAYIFTGFPWAMPPQATVDVVAGQALAWVGPHGLMLGLCFAAWGIICVGHWARWGLLAASLGVLIAPVPNTDIALTDHTVRLVQPNAPQHEKWDADKFPVFTNRLLDATAAGGAPDLVIWPETALPYLARHAGPVFAAAAERARGAPVVTGLQRYEDGKYFNSLVVVQTGGIVSHTYDKHHLVPFGEYLPLAPLMERLGLRGLAENFGSGFGAGPGPQVLDLGELGKALPLICYEAVFAHDVSGAPSRPDFLMQVTNDAWFGAGKGPLQHLAQARMRSIEQGLPMARAANTGISAMIGPKGQVLASLPLNQAGHVDARLPVPLPPTLYSRTGDFPVTLTLLVLLVLTGGLKRRKGTLSRR
ncbi:Apolipoprotein N-acyltransferase [Ascidiaceihabitans donghaensis]|uniref:Apolipoprotein N-acyltransferase n=1 Tax=Ascidiaceihabitans donghaensis TaxID=1510460 RepID=A0A2R8BBN7_9RHOB|nr:Apolipoprotein N-acyltransferase [Ascidiaceihabitans donghaensis]